MTSAATIGADHGIPNLRRGTQPTRILVQVGGKQVVALFFVSYSRSD
jgi:hypothetical protein